jgi:hypothetical protein
MKIRNLTLVVLAGSLFQAAHALNPGDIAFTAFNGDRDAVAFVALSAIPAGEVIHFTDSAWDGSMVDGSNHFAAGEGNVSWTSPAGGVAAGTVVVIDAYDTTPTASVGTVTGGSGISSSNETIYAYQGAAVRAPSAFLAAISNATLDSIAGTGLTLGSTALQVLPSGTDFAEYTGAHTGQASFADYLPLIADIAANWTGGGEGDFSGTLPSAIAFTTGAPAAATVQIAATTSVAEGGAGSSPLTFTVTRTTDATAFSVDYAVTGGTATSGSDFTPLASGTLSFSAFSGPLSQDITVDVLGDTAIESNETVIITLSNLVQTSGTTTLGNAAGTGTITNDDTVPVTYPPSNAILSSVKGSIPLAGSEIPAFDPQSKRAFASSNAGIQVVDLTNPAAPAFVTTIVPSSLGVAGLTSNDVSSVAVRKAGGANPAVLAAAIINSPKTANGHVVFLNPATGALIGSAVVGSVPDHIAFTPDGGKLLVCNEGELDGTAANIAAETVPGTVSIVDLTNLASPVVTNAGFAGFNASAAALKAAGVRIFNGGVPEFDFEPEYLAISPDGTKAMVTLQEANAVAILDIATATFTSVVPLGEKDFSTGKHDFSDRDGAGASNLVNPTTGNPVFGLYMPDAIASYQVGGQTYYVTANEGDDRNDFLNPDETTTVSNAGYDLDDTTFPTETTLKTNASLGRLTVSNATGLRGDNEPTDGDIDRILSFGGRSFSILDATGARVYDSGDMIEMIVASQFPAQFDDGRSDNKGPEPEGVTVATFGSETYAFVGLERSHLVLAFDVTNPLSPTFATSFVRSGDLNPEGMVVIPAADSPSGKALLLVSNEVSNTLTIHEITSDPFDLWLASNGYTSAGINADSDGDGLKDRVEFFFNQNPNDGSDFGNLPRLVPNAGALELDFTRLTDTGGTTGELMVSSDLATWTAALQGIDFTVASSLVTGDETAFTYALPGSGPSTPGTSATYLTPNTSTPVGASLGGVRVINEGMVGAGRISGENIDSFGETQGAASGLAVTDWAWDGNQFSGKFQVLPDRGYNSGAIFSNYAARLHRVDFTFSPYYGAGPVAQNQIVPTYVSTKKFTYDDNGTTKFTTGLNPGAATGTLFGQTVGIATAANGPGGAPTSLLSFDAEAVHLFADGSGYVSDEYGAYIARFNSSKQITGLTQLPEAARPHKPVNTLNFDAVAAPTNGRRNNQGLEGLSVTPDGTRLFALLQSATVQDTNGSQQQTRNNARLFVYDVAGANRETPVLIGEYIVKLPQIDANGNSSGLDATAAQSEIAAIGSSSFLMLPRDGNGMGKGTTDPIVFKSVQLVDFASATNILGTYDAEGAQVSPAGVLAPGVNAAATQEVINILNPADLAKFGFNTNTAAPNSNTLNEKLEGMALVPDLSTPQGNDFFLFIANDNDFQSSNVKMVDAAGNLVSYGDGRLNAGITNDAIFYAFRITIDAGGKRFYRFSVE